MILGVAIKHGDLIIALPAPNRHHNCLQHMARDLRLKTPIIGEQGFYLADGTFLDRKKAKYYAQEVGQLTKETDSSDLFSEDLW